MNNARLFIKFFCSFVNWSLRTIVDRYIDRVYIFWKVTSKKYIRKLRIILLDEQRVDILKDFLHKMINISTDYFSCKQRCHEDQLWSHVITLLNVFVTSIMSLTL